MRSSSTQRAQPMVQLLVAHCVQCQHPEWNRKRADQSNITRLQCYDTTVAATPPGM